MKIKQLFSGDTDNTFIQFFRYVFVGGIAFSFGEELAEAARAEGMKIGRILRGPIQEMVAYHTQKHAE